MEVELHPIIIEEIQAYAVEHKLNFNEAFMKLVRIGLGELNG